MPVSTVTLTTSEHTLLPLSALGSLCTTSLQLAAHGPLTECRVFISGLHSNTTAVLTFGSLRPPRLVSPTLLRGWLISSPCHLTTPTITSSPPYVTYPLLSQPSRTFRHLSAMNNSLPAPPLSSSTSPIFFTCTPLLRTSLRQTSPHPSLPTLSLSPSRPPPSYPLPVPTQRFFRLPPANRGCLPHHLTVPFRLRSPRP